jgi:hypothetical protein
VLLSYWFVFVNSKKKVVTDRWVLSVRDYPGVWQPRGVVARVPAAGTSAYTPRGQRPPRHRPAAEGGDQGAQRALLFACFWSEGRP